MSVTHPHRPHQHTHTGERDPSGRRLIVPSIVLTALIAGVGGYALSESGDRKPAIAANQPDTDPAPSPLVTPSVKASEKLPTPSTSPAKGEAPIVSFEQMKNMPLADFEKLPRSTKATFAFEAHPNGIMAMDASPADDGGTITQFFTVHGMLQAYATGGEMGVKDMASIYYYSDGGPGSQRYEHHKRIMLTTDTTQNPYNITYDIKSTSELQEGMDRDGNPIKYKDVTALLETNQGKFLQISTMRFALTPITLSDGRSGNIWLMEFTNEGTSMDR